MIVTIFIRSILLFFLACSSVYAGSKAAVEIQVVNNQQWPAEYKITLTPPEHHHAYLDKGVENAYIPITLDPKNKLAEQGLLVKQFILPQGEFDKTVQATVLKQRGEFYLSVVPNNQVSKLPLQIDVALRYQLCDEVTNVCFRPRTAKLLLELPSEGGEYVNLDADDDTTWMEKILAVFHDNQSNSLIIFSLMLLAGMLSVATPCVYPMLPITSMLIVGRAQGEPAKEKFHAGAYLIGMVSTYVLLGIAAGMTGGAFNVFMQSAMVNLAFAVFFAFFAISLLGYYEFSFMENEVSELDQKTSQINGYSGTWVMGCIAGLVVSPCVGPIVFALLLQVADNIAAQTESLALLGQTLTFWDKLSISLEGGVLMGGFGLGVGLPFFFVSVIKFKKLPKAGFWMNKIKYAFGFVILYFAYTYFAKGLGVLSVPDNIISLLAWGLVVLWLAIVQFNVLSGGERDQHSGPRQLARFVGVIMLILGGWLFISGLNNIPLVDSVHAATKSAATQVQVEDKEGGIVWLHDFNQAKEKARLTGKPIFIDFYASWCANCLEFAKETVTNKALNSVLRNDAVTLKIIDKTVEFERFKQRKEHRQLKIGLPYFAILNSQGELKWTGTDYQATKTMISVLHRLRS